MLGLGFDSGGSRTTYAVDFGRGPEDETGNEATVSLADARAASSTDAAIDWMLEVVRIQDDDDIVAWIGAAGFSAAAVGGIQERFDRPIRELARQLEADGRHCEIFIANDAISILKAPPLGGAGVAAVVGTGSVVLGAHPACPEGVLKRGGREWLVSDEGSGVWMTLECIRMVIRDIEARGSEDYHSVLLDRLTDFLSIPVEAIRNIPASHRAWAKADLVARRAAENRPDMKRFFASFVYPHIFDLAVLQAGHPHDPLAAEVLNESIRIITEEIRVVSEALAAYTADEPNRREALPVVIGGNIAANPHYADQLRAAVASSCRFVSSVDMIGDAADAFAALAALYARSNPKQRARITRAFDPLHPVVRLL
jgi:N-acetylglucosamine kinase-like BadF-type ATPase